MAIYNVFLSLDFGTESHSFVDSVSEVPEDEALMRLKLQPEGDLFPCCDGTEEISQSSSNDTPAPERTVCQPCSTGSHLVPNTREEEDSDEEVVSSEVAEGLGEGESEQEDESQEEVLEEEEQEGADEEDAGDVDSEETETKEEGVEEEEPQEHEDDRVEGGTIKSDTSSGKLMADAAPVDETEATAGTKVSVEDRILAAEETDVAQTKKVKKVVEKLADPPAERESVSEEPVRKSSVKGTRRQCVNV